MKSEAEAEGVNDRFPLLSQFIGEHIVQFEESRFTEQECLIVTATVLKSGNEELEAGTTVQILRSLKNANEKQRIVREKVFRSFVVRAFGYDDPEELSGVTSNWMDQAFGEVEKPDYLGRIAKCRVVASSHTTRTGEVINNDYWDKSQKGPE